MKAKDLIKILFGNNPTEYEQGYIDALESLQLALGNILPTEQLNSALLTAIDAYANNEHKVSGEAE